MMRSKRLLTVLLTVVLACVAFPAFSALEYDRTRSGSAASIPSGFLTGVMQGEYRVNPGDILEVLVWKDSDLSREVKVRPDGKLNYPLIGTVEASGKTIEELQAVFTKKLAEYVKFPQVTVTVKVSAYCKVAVLGEVIYPGVYPYNGSIDVLTAIGLAGDFTRDGKRESVLVISDNFTDHPKVRRVNVFRSFYHGTAGNQFVLKPDDIVYVPRTFVADMNKSLNELQPMFNTISNLMMVRTDAKTLWYNWDKPIKPQQVD